MANGTVLYADRMNAKRAERVRGLIDEAEKSGAFSKCPVPGQAEVQRFLVDGAMSTHEVLIDLHHTVKQNGNGKMNWRVRVLNEWFNRAPYAVVALAMIGAWLYAKSKGWL